VVVMAHGFAAQKDFALEKFAEIFVKNKYAVFLFDYRTFGGSEGEPMNLVSPTMHLEDWESALDFVVTKIKNIDSKNIAIWGSSFSGGHVIVTAAKSQHKNRIKAVLSQVPYLRSTSALMNRVSSYVGLKQMTLLSFFALVDITREWMGLSRYYVPVYGKPENLAILCSPSSDEGYSSMVPQNPRGGWQNKCPASIAITILFYNPYTFAPDVKAPILMIGDIQDELCPIDDVKELANNMHLTLLETNLGHFSPYLDNFDEIGKTQLEFLRKHVPSHS